MTSLNRAAAAVLLLALSSAPAAASDLLFASTALNLGNQAGAGDRLGTSIAISADGNILVTGAPQAGTRGSFSGAVYTFERDAGGNWSPASSPLTGNDTTAFDAFGYSVALSDDGKILAVGAPLHDTSVGNAGAVYLFQRTGGSWRQMGDALVAPKAEAEDQLGTSVALSADGSVLVAGAPQPSPQTTPSGKAYVFSVGASGPPTQLTPTSGGASDFFGYAVAVDSDGVTFLVGAPGTGDAEEGAVYVFSGDTVVPIMSGKRGDELGVSVAARKGTLVAGARQAGASPDGPGGVYLRRQGAGAWDLDHPLTAGAAGDGLGMSVAVSGDGKTVLAGAWKADAEGPDAGAVYLFHNDGSTWTPHPLPSCADPLAGAELGRSVAWGGPVVAAGAHRAVTNGKNEAGAVCAYDLNGLTVAFSPDSKPSDSVAAGNPVDFKFIVSNTSDQTVDFDFVDTFTPPDILVNGLLSCELTAIGCSPQAMTCKASVGEITGALSGVPAGCRVQLHLTGTTRPEARGTLENIVNVKPQSTDLDLTENNESTEKRTLFVQSDLSVDLKADVIHPANKAQALRGIDQIRYTLVVGSSGPSLVQRVQVQESFMLGALMSGFSWECTSKTPISQKGNVFSTVIPFLAPGGKVTCTATATALRDTPVRELTSTATVTGPRDLVDQPKTNNTASVTTILPVSNLTISAPGHGNVVPGGLPVTFQFSVTNTGPDSAPAGVKIHATFSEKLTVVQWSCAGSAIHHGALDFTYMSDLPVSGSVLCEVTVAAAPDVTGSAEIHINAAVPSGYFGDKELKPPPVASFTPVADLSVVVSDEQNVVPGNPLPQTFTITVANAGPSDARKARVTSVFSPGLGPVTWTCAALNGSCTPSGGGNLNDLVSLRAGGTLTYTVRFVVGPDKAGTLVNTAKVATEDPDSMITDPRSTNDNGTGKIILTPVTDLAIASHVGPATIVPGSPLPAKYTFVVTNAGPSDARRARVTHDFDPGLSAISWTCQALNGSCQPSGQGEVSDFVSLRAGGKLTYTVLALAGAEQTGSQKVNALVQRVPEDPRGDNNNRELPLSLTPVADLSAVVSGVKDVVPGSPLPQTFTVKIANAGPSDARKARVRSVFSSELIGVTWTCAALNGSCTLSGQGNLDDLTNLRVGGTLTYTVRFTVGAGAVGRLTNTASVAPEPSDPADPAHPFTDPRSGNDSGTGKIDLTPVADLAISIDPTDSNTFHVTNAGPSDVRKAMVNATFPTDDGVWSWTCTALLGSCNPAMTMGGINDPISLRVGGTLTYKITPPQNNPPPFNACVTAPCNGSDPRRSNNCLTGEPPSCPEDAGTSRLRQDGM